MSWGRRDRKSLVELGFFVGDPAVSLINLTLRQPKFALLKNYSKSSCFEHQNLNWSH